jgi:hypothetical protein
MTDQAPELLPDDVVEAFAKALYDYEPWEAGLTFGEIAKYHADAFRETARYVLRTVPALTRPTPAERLERPFFECPGCGRDTAEPNSVCAPDCWYAAKSASDFKASHSPRMSAQSERDPSVMPDCSEAGTSPVPQVREALAEPRFQALRKRLLHAITTASNDDISEPMSEKRLRHAERVAAMYVAIDFIDAALTAHPSDAAAAYAADVEKMQRQLDRECMAKGTIANQLHDADDEIKRLRSQLVKARADAIEECAKVVEAYGLTCFNGAKDYPATIAAACIYHIKKLAHPDEK